MQVPVFVPLNEKASTAAFEGGRAKEAKLPAQERAALQAVPSFDRAVRAASPETRAIMFHEEWERKKRVRLLFSRDEPD